MSSGPEMPVRVFNSPNTPIPEVQLLSNGRYHVVVTNAAAVTAVEGHAVTRWREDTYLRQLGHVLLPPRRREREVLSTAYRLRSNGLTHEAIFRRAAEFRRRDHDYETHTEIVVSPEDDIELRRIRITNSSGHAERST